MKFYSILEGNTQDVLRRLLRLINKSIARIGVVEADVDDLEDDVGTLKTTVGGNNSGLVKSVADINTAIGDATTPAAATILYRIKALENAIGDEETAATILYRIKVLEDAANGGGTETTPSTEPGEGG